MVALQVCVLKDLHLSKSLRTGFNISVKNPEQASQKSMIFQNMLNVFLKAILLMKNSDLMHIFDFINS